MAPRTVLDDTRRTILVAVVRFEMPGERVPGDDAPVPLPA